MSNELYIQKVNDDLATVLEERELDGKKLGTRRALRTLSERYAKQILELEEELTAWRSKYKDTP